MKSKRSLVLALAGLAFSAVVPAADAVVYVPGLAQAQFDTGSIDRNSDISSATNLTYAAGTIMANTSSSAQDWNGTTWSWANSRNFGYVGQMWMEVGKTYTFGKSIDDWTYVVVNGTTVIDNDTYNAIIFGSYVATATGWADIEIRAGNGSGGAGLANGATYGVAYNTVGNTDQGDFKAAANGWAALIDPGDASLLRFVYSAVGCMNIDNVAVSGDDLVVTASFSDLSAAGTVTAFYGAGDGGISSADWDSSVVIATPAAGDTASASYTVSGAASAAFVAFRLSATIGTSTPILEWSDTFSLAEASPSFKLVCTAIDYTNLHYSATCIGLGQNASSVEADAQLALDAEFSDVVQTKHLALSGLGVEAVEFTGLTTNTTYYARVVGTNDKQEFGASSRVSNTTLEPGFATGVVEFAGRGLTVLAANGIVTDFGAGSSSATIRLEASQTGDFAELASVSADAAADDSKNYLACENLSPGVTYWLRLRIVNEWGLVTYVPFAGTYSTRGVPLAVTGIGYEFSEDGSSVDISFVVTEVFSGASCSATLVYNGREFSGQSFSSTGTLTWSDITAAARPMTATVTVQATVGGVPYSQSWTATVTPGTAAHALASLADITGLVFKVGDMAILPELVGADDYYLPLDIRPFSYDSSVRMLTAREPGFSAVAAFAYDAASGTFVRNEMMGLGIVVPEPAAGGRVFLALPTSGTVDWLNAANWRNLTNGDAGYPSQANDIAMVPLANDGQLRLQGSVTVGELYIGWNATDVPGKDNKGIRIYGENGPTLTFQSTEKGRPALLRTTGLCRRDVSTGFPHMRLGNSGNPSDNSIAIVAASDLDWDCGAWPDYTDIEIRDIHNTSRQGTETGRFFEIPEGNTFRIYNMTGYKNWSDDQGENAQFWLSSNMPFTGSGKIVYEGPGSVCCWAPFSQFEGALVVRNKQQYDNYAMGSRGGSFWVGKNSQSPVPEKATLVVEGHAGFNGSLKCDASSGVVSYGNSHGYGSWGSCSNAFPAKAWIFNGGVFYSTGVNNNGVSWRADGTTNTKTICVPTGAESLVVSNGLSWISLGQQSETDRPTNSLAFASLAHAGDGVLIAQTDRLFFSYDSNGASLHGRVRLVLGGFHDYAIGGTGIAVAVHGENPSNVLEPTAPIVPWITSPVQHAQSLYFPGATADGELVLAGPLGSKSLDDVADPKENVRTSDADLTISRDITVNSLMLSGNYNKKRELGAGKTLTVTSGGLIIGTGSRGFIDTQDAFGAKTQGTLNFPNKAYIYSCRVSDSEPNEIWANIVSPEGAVFSYPGDLVLGGDQTGIDDHIAVNGTDLRLGSLDGTTGCSIDVPVHLYGGNSVLRVMKPDSFCRQTLYFWDHGTRGSKFIPPAGETERVQKLYIDGKSALRGTWGSSESGADNVDDDHFVGTGLVRVLRDDCAAPLVIRLK